MSAAARVMVSPEAPAWRIQVLLTSDSLILV